MEWTNIDLNDGYERKQNILDPYSFDTLLLEINCNTKVINEQTVRDQFEKSLKSKIDCAKEVFENNLKNIISKAVEERNSH